MVNLSFFYFKQETFDLKVDIYLLNYSDANSVTVLYSVSISIGRFPRELNNNVKWLK